MALKAQSDRQNFSRLIIRLIGFRSMQEGERKSVAQLVLSLSSSADQLPEVSAALSQIQRKMMELAIVDAQRLGSIRLCF